MMEKFNKESLKSELSDNDICCCTFSTNLFVLGIIFWLIGILFLLIIASMYMNEYYPKWYPTVDFIVFCAYIAALVMITTWMFNDSKATRTSLRVAGYLI